MNLLLLQPDQCSVDPLVADQVTLTDSRQLKHIHEHLKLTVGDSIKVGMRDGLKGTATVASLTEQQIVLDHVLLTDPPPSKLPLTLIIALPRPKVLRRLIMDAVTLGAERIILLHSYRVEKSYWQSPFLQQIDAYIQLGLEQAGDTVWPIIELKKRFRPFVEDELPLLSQDKLALVAHPYAAQSCPAQIKQPCVLVIGCEGGFIPFEIDLLQQNGCLPVSLGQRILRTETAVAHVLGRLF
ncbi:MAG: 16S rRNA (uracil(1498)-N(3))-methyltransferase [Pseudomonadota bacterium]|nr:16S rRNA (uracil(1498)-N(3))-methyltransferase [Pseudomonadota bacterium]